ncbi:MAG: hypothetical protein ABGY75_20525 [Gemmataceae bacterium]
MSDRNPDSDLPLPPAFDAALVAYSARRLPAVPPGFAERVAERWAARVRFVRRVKWATAAAAILVLTSAGGYYALRTPEPPVAVAPPPVEPTPMPKLSDSLSEMGEALAAVSRDTAEKASGPRSLFGSVDKLRLPVPAAVAPDVTPAAQSLASVPASAKASVEPLTNSTKRAIGLFLRDTGLQPAAQ